MGDIKTFLRRYKKVVYGVILFFGILLVALAWLIYPTNSNDSRFYDALISLGCSIVATEFIAFILVIMLPGDEKEENGWLPEQVIPERNEIKIADKGFPKEHLDFIAFGLRHFRGANRESQLTNRVNKGVHIRIITMDPHSVFISEHIRFEGNGDIKDEIIGLSNTVDKIKKNMKKNARGTIEIKYYDTIPFIHYCRADNKVYVGPYLPGKDSGDMITTLYDYNSNSGNMYSKMFEEL